MRYAPIRPKRILAIDPTTEGLAFAVIEDQPLELIDWGIRNCGLKKTSAPRSAIKLIGSFQPDVLVFEDCECDSSRRHPRIKRLIESLIELGHKKRIRVRTYSAEDIRRAFNGPETKAEIAAAVVNIFPELSPRLPNQRRIYEGESYGMAIFDAVAIALAIIKS